MRGYCFAWMANVLAMAKKIVWTLNVAMSVTTGQSHVRAFDVQFGVLVSNLDQRLRPLIFDIQSHFLIEVPSHFVRASGCFSGTWWRRSNRKARPTESWLRLTIPTVDEGGCPLLLLQVRSPHSSRASESCDCCNASLFCGAWTFVCGCQCLLVEKVEPWAESYFVILLCTQNV